MSDCQYPHLRPTTAYKYGCRCQRCKDHHNALQAKYRLTRVRADRPHILPKQPHRGIRKKVLKLRTNSVARAAVGDHAINPRALNVRADVPFPEWPSDAYLADPHLIKRAKEGAFAVAPPWADDVHDPPSVIDLLIAKVVTAKPQAIPTSSPRMQEHKDRVALVREMAAGLADPSAALAKRITKPSPPSIGDLADRLFEKYGHGAWA